MNSTRVGRSRLIKIKIQSVIINDTKVKSVFLLLHTHFCSPCVRVRALLAPSLHAQCWHQLVLSPEELTYQRARATADLVNLGGCRGNQLGGQLNRKFQSSSKPVVLRGSENPAGPGSGPA